MEELLEIKGVIESIRFHNDENGYTVALINTEEGEITAVGTLPSCRVGKTYSLEGKIIVHPKYGEQFSVEKSMEITPTTTQGIAGFLASGVIKGVGPKAAQAIVGKFGENTFEIIEKSPEKLTSISGIGLKRAEAIALAYQENKFIANIAVYLQECDINPAYAVKLYEAYGEDARKVIEENPYQLATDFAGIGFVKADVIAKKLGHDKEDGHRIRSGIRYTLSHYIGEGHSFVPKTGLIERAGEILDVAGELIEDALVELSFDEDIKIENLEGKEAVYPMGLFVAEQFITRKIVALNTEKVLPIKGKLESVINMAQKDMGISFSDEQRKAIRCCLENGVSVITGGPGTGKTTIIKGIIQIFNDNKIKTAVAAPTGRAAKRITETTGFEASTVHKLLEYYYAEETRSMVFGKNERNPLEYNAIIVDEASMLDLELTQALLKAIKPGCRLVLVGDGDQLPSVGAGNVLSDIINSEYVSSVRLVDIYRQSEESLIVVNAHRINKGEYPEFNEDGKDFFFMAREGEGDILDTITQLCKTRLPKHYHDIVQNPIQDIQVISPSKKRGVGTHNLNKELQKALNPPKEDLKEKTFGNRTFREGDKVMQMRNDYTLDWKKGSNFEEGEGIFNGDVGYVHSINNDREEMTVVFDEDKFVHYGFDQIDSLELAYAITVHKAQGSEFPIVVIPMSYFPPMLATRNLIYTAITRGKKIVVIVGSQERMNQMVDNNYIASRNSGLDIRLKKFLERT